jgi:hypothetical protein
LYHWTTPLCNTLYTRWPTFQLLKKPFQWGKWWWGHNSILTTSWICLCYNNYVSFSMNGENWVSHGGCWVRGEFLVTIHETNLLQDHTPCRTKCHIARKRKEVTEFPLNSLSRQTSEPENLACCTMIDTEVSRVLKKAWNVLKWSRRIVKTKRARECMWVYYTTEFSIGFVFLHSNTVPRTNNNVAFLCQIFICFRKPSSTVSNLNFQIFNNWGISMQSMQLCICNNNPTLEVSTINGFSQVKSSIFNHFGKCQ